MPDQWKEVSMVVFAKKGRTCPPATTRPISLLDATLRIQERLFPKSSPSRDQYSQGLLPEATIDYKAACY